MEDIEQQILLLKREIAQKQARLKALCRTAQAMQSQKTAKQKFKM
jgi:hypothetical protein